MAASNRCRYEACEKVRARVAAGELLAINVGGILRSPEPPYSNLEHLDPNEYPGPGALT